MVLFFSGRMLPSRRGKHKQTRVDLAKRVIQVHAVEAGGRVVSARAVARDKFIEWCVMLPAGCIVAVDFK